VVRSHHVIFVLGGVLGSVIWASLGCKAQVGVYSPLSCVDLQLLSVLFRCLMLKSFSYGVCGMEKKKRIKLMCVGVCGLVTRMTSRN